MRTFSELLTEYTRRTGISDSELARALGVRRQTIFRWKEGLVEKPRSREDVVKCAEKLRLTSAERDELLLAAGFPPETPVAPTPLSPLPDEEPAGPPPELAPTRSQPARRIEWRALLHHPFALLAVVALALLVRFLYGTAVPGQPYPSAAPGESLVVIGTLGPAPASQSDRAQPPDPSARIVAAIEREVQAARMEKVRVALWPEAIPVGATKEVITRSGASIVIGGTSDPAGQATLEIADIVREEASAPLDALVVRPAPIVLQLTPSSPRDARALALLAVGELQEAGGDLAQARAALLQATEDLPADKPAAATLFTYLGYLYQQSEPPSLDLAISAYDSAINASDLTAARVNRGVAYLRLDRPPEWKMDLEKALALQPDSPAAQQALCWAYALDSQPTLALPHCDALGNDGYANEGKAIAYAEAGKLQQATTEMQAFVDWLKKQPDSVRSRQESLATARLQTLKSGANPFDKSAVDDLKRQ